MFVISRTFCHVTPAMNFSPQMTVCNREFYFRKSARNMHCTRRIALFHKKSAKNSHKLISPFSPQKACVSLRCVIFSSISIFSRDIILSPRTFFQFSSFLPFSIFLWGMTHFFPQVQFLPGYYFPVCASMLALHSFSPWKHHFMHGRLFLRNVSFFPLHSLQLHFPHAQFSHRGIIFTPDEFPPFLKDQGDKIKLEH